MTKAWWVNVTETAEHYVPVLAASTDEALAAARTVIERREALTMTNESVNMDALNLQDRHQLPEHLWVASTSMWVPVSALKHVEERKGCCG